MHVRWDNLLIIYLFIIPMVGWFSCGEPICENGKTYFGVYLFTFLNRIISVLFKKNHKYKR